MTAQFPHFTSSVITTQLALIHTACPICVDDLSARLIRSMAPVGQTSEHLVHSGAAIASFVRHLGLHPVAEFCEGSNISLRANRYAELTGGAMLCHGAGLGSQEARWGVRRLGTFLSSMAASPPSTFFSWAFRERRWWQSTP